MSNAERVARHYFLRPRPNDVPAVQTLKAEIARLKEQLGVYAGEIRKLEAELAIERSKRQELDTKLVLERRRTKLILERWRARAFRKPRG